jgi:hypothetical protein
VSSVWCPRCVLGVLGVVKGPVLVVRTPPEGGEDTEDAAMRTPKLRTHTEDTWGGG